MSGNKNNAGWTRFQFSLRKTRGHFQIGGEGALFVFDHFFANITIVDLLLHTFHVLHTSKLLLFSYTIVVGSGNVEENTDFHISSHSFRSRCCRYFQGVVDIVDIAVDIENVFNHQMAKKNSKSPPLEVGVVDILKVLAKVLILNFQICNQNRIPENGKKIVDIFRL